MCWCVLCMGLHVFVKVVLGVGKHHLDIIAIYNCQFTQRWMSHCISFSFSGTIYIYVNLIFSPLFAVWSRNSGSPASWGLQLAMPVPVGSQKIQFPTCFHTLPESVLQKFQRQAVLAVGFWQRSRSTADQGVHQLCLQERAIMESSVKLQDKAPQVVGASIKGLQHIATFSTSMHFSTLCLNLIHLFYNTENSYQSFFNMPSEMWLAHASVQGDSTLHIAHLSFLKTLLTQPSYMTTM